MGFENLYPLCETELDPALLLCSAAVIHFACGGAGSRCSLSEPGEERTAPRHHSGSRPGRRHFCGECPRAICSAQRRWRGEPKPCLVFKAAGCNALIHEGTSYTDTVAHDYKSTARKLLGGNNPDRRGACVHRGCMCLCS